MLDDMYYGPYSVAVATCGSQLNKFQINLLVKETKLVKLESFKSL